MHTLTLSSPAETLDAVPHVLGFTPSSAVVVLALNGPRLICSAHVRAEQLHSPEAVTEVTESIRRTFQRAEVSHTIVIGYGDTFEDAARLAAAGHLPGIPERDRLIVAADRYRSTLCTDPTCCPPEGTPLASTPASLALMVEEGSAPVDSRDALTAELAPAPVPGIVPALGDLLTYEAPKGDPTDRDRYLAAACADGVPTLRERATEVRAAAAACHPSQRQRAHLLTVAGMLAYLAGDGARANVALEVLDAEEHDRPTLADLLDMALSVGLNPASLRDDWAALEI
jgi:hypothetical protein